MDVDGYVLAICGVDAVLPITLRSRSDKKISLAGAAQDYELLGCPSAVPTRHSRAKGLVRACDAEAHFSVVR